MIGTKRMDQPVKFSISFWKYEPRRPSTITSVTVAEKSDVFVCANCGGLDMLLHAVYLRTNTSDAGTRPPHNGQRLISITDALDDIAIH